MTPATHGAPGNVPTATPLFGTVLVANRGEIACRVIRTLRELGIRSVAVYSDPDRTAAHVALADEAVRIGPAPARDSYLNIDAILEAARRTGAQAVHPGYGFLSESAAFADACAAAGVAFIGPGVAALDVMGDKIRAKLAVAEHGVPTIPGVAKPGLDDAQLIEAAAEVGYPLLVKPSAGGGGKGMQVVRSADELPDALAAARRVAAAAFGDDTLFLERLVESPRHIEVQVLADTHGTTIHLGERECSLQRRHQKVVEEAPSPLLDAETRERIGRAACAVAESVDYVGAGTVEFLVSDASPGEFFFMEMNTRLQVEHPVTELVTGIDLVEWQVRIAAGEALPFVQDDIRLRGHAIEVRVYAENPERDFLPTDGTILVLSEPSGAGVRVDSGLVQGNDIVPDYDPMLSKVIAWGADRETALRRLDAALAETVILGATTNVGYLRTLLADDDVRAGRIDTTLIDRRFSHLVAREADVAELVAVALLRHLSRRNGHDPAADAHSGGRAASSALWRTPDGWRLAAPRPSAYRITTGPTDRVDVFVRQSAGDGRVVDDARLRASVTVDGVEHAAELVLLLAAGGLPARASVTLDGLTRDFVFAETPASTWLGAEGRAREFRILTRSEALAEELATVIRAEGTADPDVRSPMPGTVVSVAVTPGDHVDAGDTLVTVEAMKMEHRLTAPVAGIAHVTVSPGDLVKLDQLVATIHAAQPVDDISVDTIAEPTQSAEPENTEVPT
ncbi:acetyl-CoA carboxylase biotin carboxylase subunit [Diaminobutyricibacter tongyongensis]|uniref:biotin carboxylase n=1 Tax=Leifsonia tongyongensis TaxID=1268043 RepID=A0A6L9Y1J0_9MICO|nr:acetyl-CoA carboxylase biotin carboxylase subunit [Diaminobutyricibacter tongyongensis]NEN07513.1 acetyl-CoA carboxylase biotin carboxylase subunit [Diaminobutyricibacter tongyongensis]